jgi:Protein of unknown function (DUF3826)
MESGKLTAIPLKFPRPPLPAFVHAPALFLTDHQNIIHMTLPAKAPLLALGALLLTLPTLNATGIDPVHYERLTNRSAKLVADKLGLKEGEQATRAQKVIVDFFQDLSVVHAKRSDTLKAIPAGYSHTMDRLDFEAEKEAQAVYGKFLGDLSGILDPAQVLAIKNGMTFDIVPNSVAKYQRMFPELAEPHRDQLRVWLESSREAAITAGSAEAKLDVFRVNDLRMHSYLEAQGLDVTSAIKADDARQHAQKASG